ncbi:MAG: hypothetical protein WC775_04825 [Patescibacteria group bacterium]|jgi:hypothetical protein
MNAKRFTISVLVGLVLTALVLGVTSTPSAMAAPAARVAAPAAYSAISPTLPVTLTGDMIGNAPGTLAAMFNGVFDALNKLITGQNDQSNQISDLAKLVGDLQKEIADLKAKPAAPSAGGIYTGTIDPAQLFNLTCRLDKVATWSEVSGAAAQRQEIGGSAVQHADFYPMPGVKSVSYLIGPMQPEDTPRNWMGFGSNWQTADDSSCAGFDWVTDADKYALGRLDTGHSGLVIDLRQVTASVTLTVDILRANIVADEGPLTDPEIDALLAAHVAAMNPASQADAPKGTADAAAAPAAPVCNATRDGDSDGLGIITAPVDSVLSIETWGGTRGDSVTVVPAGESVSRSWQGGAVWRWSCTDTDQVVADALAKSATVYILDQEQAR